MTSSLLPGPFSGYEIIESLGCPHSHFKARNLCLDRLVLLKLVPFGLDRLLADARVMCSVRHPNVLELLDVLEYEGRPVLVMEFAPDCLANPVHRAPWPIWKAAQLMEKVARAVDAIHQTGHVHGLLSLGCIGLTEDGEPKVTGLEARRDPESEIATVLGPFPATEQLTESFAPFCPAVDVFALGGIMYWLLTGTSPFPGATALESLEKVRTASPERHRRQKPTGSPGLDRCHRRVHTNSLSPSIPAASRPPSGEKAAANAVGCFSRL
jgi:serine/threonine protein kinase